MALRKTRWNPATKTTWLNSLHAWLAVLLGSSRVSDGEAARRMGKTTCYQTKPPATLQGNLHLNSVAHDRQREKCSFTRALTSTGVKNALKSFALLTSSFTRYPVYYMCSQVSGPTITPILIIENASHMPNDWKNNGTEFRFTLQCTMYTWFIF